MDNILNNKNNNISKPQDNVVKDIVNIINTAQAGTVRTVNAFLVIRNWLIGKRIDEEILSSRQQDYGKQLIKNLSKELSKYGKGFSKRRLYEFLLFYKTYKKIVRPLGAQSSTQNILQPLAIKSIDKQNRNWGPAVPQSLLPWTFYTILMKIKNKKEREWYEQETLHNIWSKRQLIRNISTDYYHRVLSHQSSNRPNQLVSLNTNDYFKSLYIFDFLNSKKYKESDLEQGLIDNLSKFLLELGKGYAFIGRQVHLRSNDSDYYIDLVFYNSILKCNVLIELKTNKIVHKDIGQMLMYLDLYDKQYKHSDDKPSIGIILSSDINSDIVRYLTLETPNNIVSSKYLTYLPTKQELKNEINKMMKIYNKSNN